jgi:hypothetical protein
VVVGLFNGGGGKGGADCDGVGGCDWTGAGRDAEDLGGPTWPEVNVGRRFGKLLEGLAAEVAGAVGAVRLTFLLCCCSSSLDSLESVSLFVSSSTSILSLPRFRFGAPVELGGGFDFATAAAV